VNTFQPVASSNDAYLAAALHWLRLRLAAGSPASPATAPPEAGASSGAPVTLVGPGRRWFARMRPPLPTEKTTLLPPPGAHEHLLAQAEAAMREAEQADPQPALVHLARQLGLSRFEQNILLLAAAMELDIGTGARCATYLGDPKRPYPTFALAFTLFEEAAWDALSPHRPLRGWRLVEINQPATQPLVQSALRIDERILNYVKGLNYLDDRLSALVAPMPAVSVAPPPSQAGLVRRILADLASDGPTVVQLVGPDGASKRSLAALAADALGRQVVRLSAETLPTGWSELEFLARLWQREALLMPLALHVEAEGERAAPALRHLLARIGGIVFVDAGAAQLDLGDASRVYEVGKPTAAEQRAAWRSALGDDAEGVAGRLAGQFSLGVMEIERLARTVPPGKPEERERHLWGACTEAARPRLDALAQRLAPAAEPGNLVLPPLESGQLDQIETQVRERARVYDAWGFGRRMTRGQGISALFAGPSGTGKTMAAEVLARRLDLGLYRVDLSAVVSKYIGETEKNLRRVFDAAEDGGAILFFDEADALFGKRSEVKDSHDRYANIEINYLLQRMEAYRGLAILATNLKSALDPAFMRRLRFVVNFPFPGPEERLRIWRHAFPPETPTERLDLGHLARLSFTGGSIHNIALSAAFLAARAGGAVTMPLVLEAARAELRKLEKPINEADFRPLQQVEAG
jgi:hypothetical protein